MTAHTALPPSLPLGAASDHDSARAVGSAVRPVSPDWSAPVATVMLAGLRAIEEMVLDRETLHYREHLLRQLRRFHHRPSSTSMTSRVC
jgi:hypothetical protein